jgi:hypothetical protein
MDIQENYHNFFRMPFDTLWAQSIKLVNINLLKTTRNLLYLKRQSVPRCKHFSTRLQKPIR